MRPHGCLVVDLYPMTPDSCRLRTNIFPGENSQFNPNDIFHTISPIVEPFKKKNYMESAELQAMHNSKKQMDMGPIEFEFEWKQQEFFDLAQTLLYVTCEIRWIRNKWWQ